MFTKYSVRMKKLKQQTKEIHFLSSSVFLYKLKQSLFVGIFWCDLYHSMYLKWKTQYLQCRSIVRNTFMCRAFLYLSPGRVNTHRLFSGKWCCASPVRLGKKAKIQIVCNKGKHRYWMSPKKLYYNNDVLSQETKRQQPFHKQQNDYQKSARYIMS